MTARSDRRAKLAALLEAATKGPWEVYQPHDLARALVVAGDAELGNWLVCGDVRRAEDREFIVAARNDLPAILADNERLEAALQYIGAQTAWRDYPIDSVSCSNAIFDIKDMHETAVAALAGEPT